MKSIQDLVNRIRDMGVRTRELPLTDREYQTLLNRAADVICADDDTDDDDDDDE